MAIWHTDEAEGGHINISSMSKKQLEEMTVETKRKNLTRL